MTASFDGIRGELGLGVEETRSSQQMLNSTDSALGQAQGAAGGMNTSFEKINAKFGSSDELVNEAGALAATTQTAAETFAGSIGVIVSKLGAVATVNGFIHTAAETADSAASEVDESMKGAVSNVKEAGKNASSANTIYHRVAANSGMGAELASTSARHVAQFEPATNTLLSIETAVEELQGKAAEIMTGVEADSAEVAGIVKQAEELQAAANALVAKSEELKASISTYQTNRPLKALVNAPLQSASILASNIGVMRDEVADLAQGSSAVETEANALIARL